MPKVLYAGSFDLLTNGHLWMIDQGLALFGGLTVAVGHNPDKRYMFSLQERLVMLNDATSHLKGVEITSFDTSYYLVDFAMEHGFDTILRGIRSSEDFNFEKVMTLVNEDIQGGLKTVFLTPPLELGVVSSSMVKSLIGPNRWPQVVSKYVPHSVVQALVRKMDSGS